MNGWSPRTVTLGADGQLTSVTVTEARFTPGEVSALLASRRAQHAPRGPHGLLLSEATDPSNQFKFHVPEPITDHAQVPLSAAKADWAKKNPNTDPETRLWRVEKRD